MANAFWRFLVLVSAGLGFLVHETGFEKISFETVALSFFWVLCLVFGLAHTIKLKE